MAIAGGGRGEGAASATSHTSCTLHGQAQRRTWPALQENVQHDVMLSVFILWSIMQLYEYDIHSDHNVRELAAGHATPLCGPQGAQISRNACLLQ